MCRSDYNIKVVEGNAFALIIPLISRVFVNGLPIDTPIDIPSLQDCKVKIGDAEYTPELNEDGVRVLVPGTLARATYDIIVTATYYGSPLRAAYFDALTIVQWNEQSDAQQYIQGSPITLQAAYVIGGAMTDAELEALKAEYREKIAAAEQAEGAAEAAKEAYDRKAEMLDGVAQQSTLTQGVQDIREDISHIDIDTSGLAKESQVKDGNDTAISVGKDVRSELGTGSDTAAETGTLFAVVKWTKNKIKDIYNALTDSTNGLSAIRQLIGYTISEIDNV